MFFDSETPEGKEFKSRSLISQKTKTQLSKTDSTIRSSLKSRADTWIILNIQRPSVVVSET